MSKKVKIAVKKNSAHGFFQDSLTVTAEKIKICQIISCKKDSEHDYHQEALTVAAKLNSLKSR